VENLFKVEVLAATNFWGYFAGENVTEWYATLPGHINVNKIIAVTNVNQGALVEYSNIDYDFSCIRMGCQGNLSTAPLATIKVAVAYFT